MQLVGDCFQFVIENVLQIPRGVEEKDGNIGWMGDRRVGESRVEQRGREKRMKMGIKMRGK